MGDAFPQHHQRCAFIAGTASPIPYICDDEIPSTYPQGFIEERENEVRDAITRVQTHYGVDLTEITKVKPRMFARGGFGKFQSTLAKIVRGAKAKILRDSLTEQQKNWTDLNSTEIEGRVPSLGASAWVTVASYHPRSDPGGHAFLITFRAMLGLPQVREGYPCA